MPTLVCPECGEYAEFHNDEIEDVKIGEAICPSCTLERGYNVFLGEVLDGQHPELIAELRERLEEEA